MKKKIIYGAIVLLLIAFVIIGILNQPEKESSKTYFYLGTVINITLYDADDQVFEEISDLILKYDNMFSRTIQSSDIAQLNNKKEHTLSQETLDLIIASIKYYDVSEGYFDISINPIVELWGIGTENAQVPSHDQIQEALTRVSSTNIVIDKNLVKLKNNASVDLGAIAKGFIADEIVRLLEEKKIKKALINLGGNVYAHGSNNESDWQVGIREPVVGGDVLLAVGVSNKSVVTSGIYERYLEHQGQTYHHIFNPFTGFPMDNDLLSMTVISDKSIDGDALSTALFNLGAQAALEKAKLLNVDVIAITKDKEIIMSEGIKDKVQVLLNTYKVK